MKLLKLFLNVIWSFFLYYLIYIGFDNYYFIGIIFLFILTNYHMFSLKRDKNFTDKLKKVANYYHFTLIVPVKNEEKNIRNSLINIDKINYPSDKFKVIVINDNSTDNTLNIINEMNLSDRFKIVNRTRSEGFVSGVLNDALDSIDFSTDIIGIADADCVVSPNILEIVNMKFQNFVGGLQIQEWHYNLNTQISKPQHLGVIYDNFKMLKEPYFKVGHFFNYFLYKYIKYNEKSILEDMEYSNAILDLKYPVEVISDVLIYRTFPENIKSVYSQQYRYCLGLNMINIERDIINSDIVLGIILILSFFTIFFNFKIGFTIFYYLNFLGILIINHVASFYYNDIHQSALENAPYNLKNVISHQNKIKYTFPTIFYTNIFHIVLIVLRIISYIRYSIGKERIVWNRFK